MSFETLSGLLTVTTAGDLLTMDFPARPPAPRPLSDPIRAALGVRVQEVLESLYLVAVVADEAAVRALRPDFPAIAELHDQGLAVTAAAAATDVDFVSRFFAPALGVPEDPVTGSAHCVLAPYWSARLDRTELVARQLSRRGGMVRCRVEGERVHLCGRAFTYLEGELRL